MFKHLVRGPVSCRSLVDPQAAEEAWCCGEELTFMKSHSTCIIAMLEGTCQAAVQKEGS